MYTPNFIKVRNEWQPIIRARHSKAFDIQKENLMRMKFDSAIPNFDPKKSYANWKELLDNLLPF